MHSDDELLRTLGRIARQERDEERAHLDDRWDAFCEGRLPEEEVAALRAAAADDAAAQRAYDAFRPLGASFRRRLAERLGEQLAASQAGDAAEPQARSAADPTEPSWRGRRPSRRPRSEGRRRAAWLPWAVPAALAAAALVLLLQPAAHLAPLPAYDLVLHGAVRERRSTAPPASGDEGRIFARGNLFDLQLVPAGEVEGPVAVRVFRDGGSGFEPWTQAAELATIEGGAIRIRGRLGEDLDLPPGEWRLVVAIGRPGELPAAADLRRDETAGGPWVVSEVGRIRIVEEGMIEPGS